MNKRDLIKALFKDPTIKALYESGHFNATDINRAILTEADDMDTKAKEANSGIEHSFALIKAQELKKEYTEVEKKIVALKNAGKLQAAEDLEIQQKNLRDEFAKLAVQISKLGGEAMQLASTAAKTPSKEDDKASATASETFAQKLAALKSKVPNPDSASLDKEMLDTAQSMDGVVNSVKPELEKVRAAVKAAKQGGEGDQAGKIQKYVKFFDKKVPQGAQDKFNQVFGIQSNESDKPANLIARAFAAYYLMKTNTLKEAEGQLGDYESIRDDFVTKMELNPEQKQALENILKNQNFHAAVAEVRDYIVTSGKDTTGDEGDTGTASLDQWLENKSEEIQQFVNSNKLFKTNLAKAYGEAVGAEPQGEAGTQQTTAEPAAQPSPTAAKQQTDQKPAAATSKRQVDKNNTSTMQPTGDVDVDPDAESAEFRRKEDEKTSRLDRLQESLLEGIYLVNEQEGVNPEDEGDNQQPGPVEVGDVRTMLTQLQDLFNKDSIAIDVQEIWEASQKDSTNIDQQQKEALEQQADVNQDKDLSSMEQEELDASWKTTLDIFFGKSTESSSFMNQLLLRKQSDLLYGMIQTLTQIIVGNRKPQTGGGVEAASLTDQGNEEDNKQPETQAAPAPGKRDDVLEEQVVNEIFDSLFGGKKEKNETVQLSRQSTKNMRQHLEAMVTLLRSLKVDISDYSQFSTRESADPRFDGSSLKKALDAKLAVVQKRIGMLAKQIEISVLDQDNQIEKDAQQLAADMTEVLDLLSEDSKSERRLKVQKVREVYNEMRRMYTKGLMTSLENKQVRQAKEGAQQIKDYILNEKEFLSYFPQGMVVGTSVVTLSEAESSMKQIIKKFIDTIRDIVTITKSQEVSSSDLGTAAKDLVQIADRIEALFKVPSEIDEEFMKKYLEAAANNPKSAPLSDEKPSAMGQAEDMIEKFKSAFGWMSDEVLKLVNSFKYDQEPLEQFAKITDNTFGAKTRDKNTFFTQFVNNADWIGSLDENQKGAVTRFSTALLNEIESIKERQGTKLYLGKLLIRGGLDKKYAVKVFAAFRKTSKDDKKILEDLIQNDTEGLAKYLQNFLASSGKIGKQNSERMAAMLGSMERVNILPDEEGDDVFPEIERTEQMSKSEEQMKQLIQFLKEKDTTGTIKKLQLEIGRHFEEESDIDIALSILVYYILHQNPGLQEVIGPKSGKKIQEFLKYMRSSQFLTQEFKKFISTNIPKIAKFLNSRIVKSTMQEPESFLMKTISRLMKTKPDLKRTVDKLNKGTEKDTASSNEDADELEDVDGFDDNESDEIASPDEVNDLGGEELKREARTFQKNVDKMIKDKDSSDPDVARFLDTYRIITNNIQGKTGSKITDEQKRIILSNIIVLMKDFTGNLVYEEKQGMKKMRRTRIQAAHKSQALEVLRKYEKEDSSLKVEDFFKLVGGSFSDLYMLLKKKSKLIMNKLLKGSKQEDLEESLKPIIEAMLKEHYNH